MGDTFFLFSEPSFLEGLARNLDLGSTLSEYNESLTGEQADAIAIHNDWAAIGIDILNSADEVSAHTIEEREPEFDFQET
jgi:hypothetical protein